MFAGDKRNFPITSSISMRTLSTLYYMSALSGGNIFQVLINTNQFVFAYRWIRRAIQVQCQSQSNNSDFSDFVRARTTLRGAGRLIHYVWVFHNRHAPFLNMNGARLLLICWDQNKNKSIKRLERQFPYLYKVHIERAANTPTCCCFVVVVVVVVNINYVSMLESSE